MNRNQRIATSILSVLATTSLIAAQTQKEPTINDKDIHVIHYEEMPYPPMARAAHFPGVVIIRVKLDDQGRVVDAEAVSGSEALAGECISNARKWRFQPNAEKSAVIVYNFIMPGGGCKSAQSFFMLRGPNLVTVIGCDVPIR